jgi:hypothetical protein
MESKDMSPPDRSKGELHRSAQREGSPVNPPDRSKGELHRSAQREGSPVNRRDLMKMLAALGVAAPIGDTWADAGPMPADVPPAAGKEVYDGAKEGNKFHVTEHTSRQRLGVCGTGWHTHPPHLTVCLTDVKAKVALPGKAPFVAENKAGDVFFDPGGPHAVENVGSRDTRVYLIDLKG